MINNIIYDLPNITVEELTYLKDSTDELSQEDQKKFILLYKSKRRNPHLLLFLTLFGFLGFAGLHRFATNKWFLGLLYLFTAGFFFIGTILDIIGYKNITNKYNRKMAKESLYFLSLK